MDKNFKAEETNLSDFYTEPSGGKKGGRSKKKKPMHARKKHSRIRYWWSHLKKWKRVAIVTAVSVVLTLTILLGGAWGVLKYIYNVNVFDNINKDLDNLGIEKIIDEGIVNVALFGIDTRKLNATGEKAFKGLSDSIMIMSLNTKTKKVKIISVMRDSLVPIDGPNGKKYTKINSAYSTGGPELAIKTLNQVFGLDIRDYATVNFAGMADIIDAVGGIDVTLTDKELDVYVYSKGKRVNRGLNGLIAEQCKILKKDPTKLYIKKGGTYHLNGTQAVAYARIRYAANVEGTSNDYGRTDRQRYVMEQLFNKAIKIKKSEYAGLAKAMLPCCKTSLEFEKVLALATNILTASPTFEQTRVPLYDYQMNNRSYVYYDLNYAGKLVRAFIYDDITPEKYMETNGVEKNDWYAQIGGKSVSGGQKTASSSSNTSKTSSADSKPSEIKEEPTPSESPDTSSSELPDDTVSDGSSSQTSENPDAGTDTSSVSDTSSDSSAPSVPSTE